VKDIVQIVEASVSKRVALIVDAAPNLPAIEADAAQLQQVVMNLVLNGAEALGEARGAVRVSTGIEELSGTYADVIAASPIPPGTYVYVDVTDDGCGMDAATQSRIFDPFFTTKMTGRGLGLAAVVGIMRAHRGAIRITSAPGKGSAFRAYFPASTRHVSSVPSPEPDMFRGSGVVLVIDDAPQVRSVARRMLEWFGFDVIEAQGGREGIERFREASAEIALVIVDMMMPELDGEEVFREIRAIRADARVLLSSGYGEEEARARFHAEGLAGFLEKPYTTTQLATTIARALRD
jgi:CheY-like chemotaxis protein